MKFANSKPFYCTLTKSCMNPPSVFLSSLVKRKPPWSKCNDAYSLIASIYQAWSHKLPLKMSGGNFKFRDMILSNILDRFPYQIISKTNINCRHAMPVLQKSAKREGAPFVVEWCLHLRSGMGHRLEVCKAREQQASREITLSMLWWKNVLH